MRKDHQVLVLISVALFIIGMLLVSSQLAMAKGNFAKIVISGGQLASEIEVTDPSLLGFFSFSDFTNAHTQKPKVGEGYVVTRYEQYQDGTFHAWDRLHYYPNTTGLGGYVFYDGLINGGSEYDGQWYTASPEGDAALRRILTAHISNASTSTILPSVALLVGLAGIAIVMIVGFVVIKRRTSSAVHVS